MSVALVVNPTSGKGRGKRVGAQVADLLRRSGAAVEDLSATSYADAQTAAGHAVAKGVETLVVVGGDGMVHLGVNACGGTPTKLGYVPAGTGNDLARNLAIPWHEPQSAVDAILAGATLQMDLGRTVGRANRWFAGVLGAGFDAVVTERANRMAWPKGQSRYNIAMLLELPVFKPIPYRIVADGQQIDTNAMLVAVANTRSFGGGMKVAPDASYTDGLFDVMVLHEVSVPTLLRLFPKVFRGAHVSHPAVQIVRARTVRLEAEGIFSQADGEMFAKLPLDLECVQGALNILAPGVASTLGDPATPPGSPTSGTGTAAS